MLDVYKRQDYTGKLIRKVTYFTPYFLFKNTELSCEVSIKHVPVLILLPGCIIQRFCKKFYNKYIFYDEKFFNDKSF